jgi:acyl carrier protein
MSIHLSLDEAGARVRVLSDAQRRLLAERLGVTEPGGKRLVAYVVRSPDSAVSPAELRDHVAREVPAPAVPEVVLVEVLPRTESGKVNLHQLAKRGGAARAAREVAPMATATEESLLPLWRALLPAGDIGAHDSFFELGGHSLLATMLLSRIRAAFAVEISLRRMFETPTVAGLARAIDEARAAGELSPTQPITLLARR